ncbi:carboxypeptidase regulatory-like domain-containing protein [Corallococcus exercitus]|uniref:Carboxypeptidase regulatory-like domain-containing protein n=1 Tax=Corallococcus exercitus TaxID=2316736 RepID=A0A7Y4KLX5_9BACT|nr:carboxypeptidase-like regulatory domain-containing protein [Corallococcus exercitus]NOK35610.1 carboxypeptidase regulatory-like domain-containing protein [Corallococcus exercitus]
MRARKLGWWAAVLVLGLGVAVVSFRDPGGRDSSASSTSPSANTVRAGTRYTAPRAPHAEGSLRITGVVRDARGPVAGVQVSASQADADTLSERLAREAPPALLSGSRNMRQAGSSVLEQEFARLVEAREGEAPEFARTATAEDGTFVLDGLPAGAFTLWALGDTGATVQPDIQAGSDGVTLTLEEGVFLSGVVVDQLQGDSIPGALVTVIHESQARYFDVLADAQGRFRVGPLPPGRYLKVASAKGWRTRAFREGVWLDADVDVTLELQQQLRLEGVVLNPEGQPASGLTVHMAERDGGDTRTTRSDARGRFAFDEVVLASYRLWARSEDETTFGEAEATPPKSVALRMKPVLFMEGTVRDEQGRPLKGVRLGFQWQDQGDRPSPMAVTDEAGHYRVGPLRKSGTRVILRCEHHLDAQQDLELDEPHAGPWDFTLRRALSVEGLVVDTEGTPLPGVEVKLERTRGVPEASGDSSSGIEIARSDDAGRFIVDSEEGGAGHLLAEAADFRAVSQAVVIPSTGVRVVMGRGASVSGTVVDAKGRPMANVNLQLWDTAPQSGSPRTTPVDKTGAFSFQGLKAGHYVVEARLQTPGVEHAESQAVDLEERAQARVALRFEEGRTLEGRTVDTEGQPVPGVRVHACLPLEDIPPWRTDGPDCRSRGEGGVLSGADGRFVLKHLTAPSHQLVAWKEGHDFAPARSRGGTPEPAALIVATGQEGIELVLEQRPRLRGQVVSEEGAPLPCTVEVGTSVHVPAGTFDVPLPVDGPQPLFVKAKGFLELWQKLVVRPGQDIDLGMLRMTRARLVRVIVLDEVTHAPLAGTDVSIEAIDERPLSDRPYSLPFVRGSLDAEGGIDVEGVPFARVVLSIRRMRSSSVQDVTVEATQDTVTVRMSDPTR